MGVKFTYGDIRNTQTCRAIDKIVNKPGSDFRTQQVAYWVRKFGRKWEQEVSSCQEKFIDLLKNFAKMDEKGNFLPPVGKPLGFYDLIEGKEAEYASALTAFEKTEFEIDMKKFHIDDLSCCALSAIDVIALDKMIDDPEPKEEMKKDGRAA